MIELVDRNSFELAYRRYMEEGGHSYDAWDISAAWTDYSQNPQDYNWLGLQS